MFIALDLRPIHTVDGRGFKLLLKVLKPSYEIPSRPKIREVMLEEFANEKRVVSGI